MLALLFVVGCGVLGAGYVFYGRKLDDWLGVDSERRTPAHEQNDGVDYVPARAAILFGHHFSSIAGAGPIVGPILAAALFGWLPTVLWILVGSILIGGVHDYAALVVSVRNRGRSIGEMCRLYLSPLTYRIFLMFIWFSLVYVLVVFLDLTGNTFVAGPGGKAELKGCVATASVFYIAIALVFGFCVYRLKMRFGVGVAIFVPLVFVGLFLGKMFPVGGSKNAWLVVLLIYCFVASITPVWILLQPRDFLSSFLLYACLIVGGIGLVVAAVQGTAPMALDAFTAWTPKEGKYLFPLLFITVACGAVSGFHSVVSSGTTAKQLDSEKSARPVAYGGMLVEGVLALIALAAVGILTQAEAGAALKAGSPVAVFAGGMGVFGKALGIPTDVGAVFGLLAVSTFLLTTLDTATRLGRFVLEELFSVTDKRWRFVSTAATLVLPAVFVFMTIEVPDAADPSKMVALPAWKAVWPAFGTTNQLLAALTLLVVFVWLVGTGAKRTAFVFVPMVFMGITAGTSLLLLVWTHLLRGGDKLIGSLCAFLFVLAAIVVVDSVRFCLRRPASTEAGSTG